MKSPILVALLFFSSFQISYSKTIVILFGGATGMKYSPDSVEANVGDIIRWEGSFSTHPLVSTSIPVGANSISVTTGTSFEYSINIAGDYRFKCDVHNFQGVVKASATNGVHESENSDPKMFFSQEFNSLNFKNINSCKTNSLCIFNESGQSIYHVVLSSLENAPLNTCFLRTGTFTACLIEENKIMQYCRFIVAD
jgi:plastocyanin